MAAINTRTIWYHGGARITDWRDYRWDRDRTTSDGNAEGPGMYFTTSIEEAVGYLHRMPDPVVYAARLRPSFRLLSGKPTLPFLLSIYAQASAEDQETLVTNFGVEYPAPMHAVQGVLRNYANASTKADAAIQLYHDLFRYDDGAYVAAMREAGYDGFIVPRRQAGSRQRDHLILWNVAAVELGEVPIPEDVW